MKRYYKLELALEIDENKSLVEDKLNRLFIETIQNIEEQGFNIGGGLKEVDSNGNDVG